MSELKDFRHVIQAVKCFRIGESLRRLLKVECLIQVDGTYRFDDLSSDGKYFWVGFRARWVLQKRMPSVIVYINNYEPLCGSLRWWKGGGGRCHTISPGLKLVCTRTDARLGSKVYGMLFCSEAGGTLVSTHRNIKILGCQGAPVSSLHCRTHFIYFRFQFANGKNGIPTPDSEILLAGKAVLQSVYMLFCKNRINLSFRAFIKSLCLC